MARRSQVAARDALVDVEHPRLGTIWHIASPLRVQPHPAPDTSAPARGEHTHQVLRDTLGYSNDRIATLQPAGALGS